MSCEERNAPEQKHEVPDSATMTWNGYMTSRFETMIKDMSRRIEGVEMTVQEVRDRICAIETKHTLEEEYDKAKILE